MRIHFSKTSKETMGTKSSVC
ncbi:hypothetical protein [Petralouisia muris]